MKLNEVVMGVWYLCTQQEFAIHIFASGAAKKISKDNDDGKRMVELLKE